MIGECPFRSENHNPRKPNKISIKMKFRGFACLYDFHCPKINIKLDGISLIYKDIQLLLLLLQSIYGMLEIYGLIFY